MKHFACTHILKNISHSLSLKHKSSCNRHVSLITKYDDIFYPEFVALFGKTLPDYRGQFLRGLKAGKSLGQKVGHSLASHNHTQPAHTHEFNGELASDQVSGIASGQAISIASEFDVSGTAEGQNFNKDVSLNVTGDIGGGITIKNTGDDGSSGSNTMAIWKNYPHEASYLRAEKVSSSSSSSAKAEGTISGKTSSSSVSGKAKGTVSGYGSSSLVSASVTNKSVKGSLSMSGDNPTDYTGGVETAPDHIYVKYIIKVRMYPAS